MKHIIYLTFSLFLLTSCYYDKAQEIYPTTAACDTTNVKYATQIVPILNKNCALSGCHNSTSNAAGIAYGTHAETLITINNGKLINSIKHVSGFSQMPKGGGKMSDCDINKIQNWVNKGALNN